MKHNSLDHAIIEVRDALRQHLDSLIENLMLLRINVRDDEEINHYAHAYVEDNVTRVLYMLNELRAYEWALQTIEDDNRPEPQAA